MTKIKNSEISIGQQFTAHDIAELLEYRDYHAVGRGIVTPAGINTILLMVTQKKEAGQPQYKDRIEGDILYMAGQAAHGTDARLAENLRVHKDDFLLFYRQTKGEPYTYLGECTLINAVLNEKEPSEFEFLINAPKEGFEDEDSLMDYLINLPTGSGSDIEAIQEGKKRIANHIRYERNRKNRENAIRIHGTACMICGFDYDKVYGEDVADSYIEVHHIKQLSEGEQKVDPAKDLITVCANCHRMLHRRRINNISVDELKKKIKR